MLKLPRIPSNQALVDDKGYATIVYQQWWQQVVTQVESSVNGIEAALAAAGIALDAAAVAQAAAEAANAAASDSMAATAATAREQALQASSISPDGVLTADATTITIAAHTRIYPGASGGPSTSVSVSGGTVAASAPGDVDYVSYSDPTRAGGAVTYVASTISPTQTGDTHVVGSVTIPATGIVNGGRGPRKPGFVDPEPAI